jgi:hypothetical protein
MARSGPGEDILLLRYATRVIAQHVATGCMDHSDALLLLISAGLNAGMPPEHPGLLVKARLGVELALHQAVTR